MSLPVLDTACMPSRQGVRAASREGGDTSLLAALMSAATQQDTGNMRARLSAGVATPRRLAAQHEAREVDNKHSETSERRAAAPLAGTDAVRTDTNHADWLRAAETRLWGAPPLVRH